MGQVVLKYVQTRLRVCKLLGLVKVLFVETRNACLRIVAEPLLDSLAGAGQFGPGMLDVGQLLRGRDRLVAPCPDSLATRAQ